MKRTFLGLTTDKWEEAGITLLANAIKCVGYGIGLAIILLMANTIISLVR